MHLLSNVHYYLGNVSNWLNSHLIHAKNIIY